MTIEEGLKWHLHKHQATSPVPVHKDIPPRTITQVSLLVRRGGVGLLKRFVYEEETLNTFTAKINARKVAEAKGLEFWYLDDVVQYQVNRKKRGRNNDCTE